MLNLIMVCKFPFFRHKFEIFVQAGGQKRKFMRDVTKNEILSSSLANNQSVVLIDGCVVEVL